jgi:hypothetical protein
MGPQRTNLTGYSKLVGATVYGLALWLRACAAVP